MVRALKARKGLHKLNVGFSHWLLLSKYKRHVVIGEGF